MWPATARNRHRDPQCLYRNELHEPLIPRSGLPKRTAAEAQTFKIQRRQARTLKLFEPALVKMATIQSFVMLDPRNMMRNPVMFLVEVGTVLTAIVTVQSIVNHAARA